jgi:hypothetical protein
LPTESALEPPKAAPEFPRLNPWTPRALAALARKREGRSLPSRFYSGPFPFLAPVPSPANPLSYNPPLKNVDPQILDAMKRGKCNAAALAQAATHEKVMRYDYRQGGGAGPFLDYIAGQCKQANTRLIVMFIPAPMTANPIYMNDQLRLGAPSYGKVTRLDGAEYRAAQRNLSEVTKKLGVPFLDATDEMIKGEKTGRMYWSIDTHCTPAGYRLLAEVAAHDWTTRGVAGAESSKPR